MINFDTNCYHSALVQDCGRTDRTDLWLLLTTTYQKRRHLSFKFWHLDTTHCILWVINILSIANDVADLKRKTGYHEYESHFIKRHSLNNRFTFLFHKGTSFPVNMLRTRITMSRPLLAPTLSALLEYVIQQLPART
jgi:hypothetical protein